MRDVTERREVDDACSPRPVPTCGWPTSARRIARDLHDTVIQRLFAAGMSLQGIVSRIPEPEVRGRAEDVVEQLDETIREIRSTIFSLQVAEDRVAGLRGELLSLARELRESLGFLPVVRFAGAVETIDPRVAEHLVPVVREALANVARHAEATSVTVLLEVGREVVLEIDDDGVGPASHARAASA